MGLEPLSRKEVGLQAYGWEGETPLWYYVLKEAEIRQRGERLGEVGGRIVAEVLIGLLEGDPNSYLNMQPNWRPTLSSMHPGNFTMADLLRVAASV